MEAVMKAKQDDPSALHVVLFQEVRTRLLLCKVDSVPLKLAVVVNRHVQS